MRAGAKTLVRTVQTSFGGLEDAKFALMRGYRRVRRIPFDADFAGLRLFPDAGPSLFLDVGANRGQSADAMLMLTRNSRVHLFEPNPLLCDKLERQFAGCPRVTISRFGLGGASTEQPLYVPFYKRWMFDGLASFDAPCAASWLEDRILFYRREHLSLREVPCRLRRLDDLGLEPFFVKIDVQGSEYGVLRGGERTLRCHEPVLLIESPPQDDVAGFLRGLGYELYTFAGGVFIRGVATGNNTYFMTAARAELVRSHIVSGPHG